MRFPPPEQIRLYDTTLRDGEQTPGVAFSPTQKYEIAVLLSDVGVDVIDLGFPSVAPSEKDALRRIVLGRERGEIRQDVDIVVMCRANERDVDSTLETLESIEVDPSQVTVFVFTAASDLHVKYKLGRTLLRRYGEDPSTWLERPVSYYREANRRMLSEVVAYARRRGFSSIEAGMGEDGSRADPSYLEELARASVEAGATRLSIADTVGVLTPEATKHYMRRLVEAAPSVPWVVHFHNDFGLAVINTITALAEGVRYCTVTVNGLGERAGNTPLHTLVAALWKLYGVRLPRFKYDRLPELKELVERCSGIPVQANEPIVGFNVFSHETGIHTAGVLVDRRIYEAAPSEDFGRFQRFVFGKHSGRRIVEEVLKENMQKLEMEGISLSEELVEKTTAEVKRLREERAESGDFLHSIERYYEELGRLGLDAREVVEIAIRIGRGDA